MIYCYAMLLSTRSSPLKLDLSLSSSFTKAGTPLPDYHSIKVVSPFRGWPRPLSLFLIFGGLLSISFPLLYLCYWPREHVPELLIGPDLLPLGCGLQRPGAKNRSTPPTLSPDFLPMKCLILNYSHPTLIVIDWGSRGSGWMTDRLGSLWACPPRRGEGEENEEWGSARQLKVTQQHYLQSPSGLLPVRLGYRPDFKWLNNLL